MSRRLSLLISLLLLGLLPVPAISAQEPTEPPLSSEASTTIHVVQRGETLFSIAQIYDLTVEAIAATNNIDDPTRIEVGQRLIIPGASTVSAQQTSVVAGLADSLSSLALSLGTSEQQLAGLNFIVNPELLFAGQALLFASDDNGATAIPSAQPYIVQADDTASVIAARHNVSLLQLLQANRLTSTAQLYAGRRLLIPGSGPPVSAISGPWTNLEVEPLPVEQGRTFVLTINTAIPGDMSGRFLSRDLRFLPDGQTHIAIIGIHALTRPGVYPITLTFDDRQGQITTITRSLLIDPGGYEFETIDVPADLEALLDEELLDTELLGRLANHERLC